MTTSESLGYLKGLLDGLDLDENKKETKIYKAVIEVLENLSLDIDDANESIDMIAEQVDAIDEDLSDVEDYLDDECEGCDGCCGDDDEETYELECPSCGEKIVVDEDTVLDGTLECPACGELLEFEVEYEDEDEPQE